MEIKLRTIKKKLNQIEKTMNACKLGYHIAKHNGKFCTYRQNRYFFRRFIDNIKQEMASNREMQKHIDQFRAKRNQLEQTNVLVKSRTKLNTVYNESRVFLKLFQTLNSGVQLFSKNTEYVTTALKQTSFGRGLSVVAKNIAKKDDGEVSWTTQVYKAPPVLKKRSDLIDKAYTNTMAVELVVYKESTLKKTLQALGTDSGIVRWLAWVGRSVAEVLFPNKYGDVITALGRVDPDFEIPRFIKFCEKDVVPNVLEAMVRPDLEVLKDWCTQQEYARLVYLLDERRQKATHGTHCQILDVNNVDVVGGLFTDEGPVLFLSLDTQEMNYSKAADGTVINDSVVMCHHAWALLRDLDEPNPKAAWRLADVAFHTVPMMF